MRDSQRPRDILPILIVLLLLIGGGLLYLLFAAPVTPEPAPPVSTGAQYLAAGPSTPQQSGFRFRDVPPWLFVHVGLIAGCQLLALIAALQIARREYLTSSAIKSVQFLCEIPMYLGLFGTLLGVCLTQFITGSLVAPLAYLTTMSGIVLHVFGKLTIWLPLPGEGEIEDEG